MAFGQEKWTKSQYFLTFPWLFVNFSWLKAVFFDFTWLSFLQRGIGDLADAMLLGLIALERMTQTQGITTLGLPIDNDKDKVSWQQMVIRKSEKGKRKEMRKGTWLQAIDKWDSELKKTKMGILASLH